MQSGLYVVAGVHSKRDDSGQRALLYKDQGCQDQHADLKAGRAVPFGSRSMTQVVYIYSLDCSILAILVAMLYSVVNNMFTQQSCAPS